MHAFFSCEARTLRFPLSSMETRTRESDLLPLHTENFSIQPTDSKMNLVRKL
jgi:hypothetical protein